MKNKILGLIFIITPCFIVTWLVSKAAGINFFIVWKIIGIVFGFAIGAILLIASMVYGSDLLNKD